MIQNKENAKVVKVKPTGSENEEACCERYLLCTCPSDSFPYILNEIFTADDLLSYEWVPVAVECIIEYDDELTLADESACYMARIADDELDGFENRLESFMAGNHSAEEIQNFVHLCSQGEADRLAVFCDLIAYNTARIREKNYWKWHLYKRADNPYNRKDNQ